MKHKIALIIACTSDHHLFEHYGVTYRQATYTFENHQKLVELIEEYREAGLGVLIYDEDDVDQPTAIAATFLMFKYPSAHKDSSGHCSRP